MDNDEWGVHKKDMVFDFPNFDPVALSLGPLVIRWYALAYLAGFLGGWWYAARWVGRYLDGGRPSKDDLDDFLSWAIVGVILGGRLGYVLFYQFEYYAAHPLEILQVWNGGMAFHGGVAGAALAVLGFSLRRGIHVFRMGDVVAIAAPIGLFFGRLSNFVNGELYGRITDGSFGVVFPGGGPLPRHPSQIYEAALEGLALFVVLLLASRCAGVRDKPGSLAALFLMGYGVFRSIVELFREPDAHLGFIVAEISMGQLLSLPMVLAGIGLWVYVRRS